MPKKTASSSMPPINERISFLMHRIDAQLTTICNPHFRHLGVVLHNSRMLVLLMEMGEARVSDLVERMVLPQSTISHQIRELEKREFISRADDPQDTRSTLVKLTPKGRRVAKQCNDLSTDIYGAMVEGLSETDIERLRKQLRGMFERLEKLRVKQASGRVLQTAQLLQSKS